MKYKCCKYIRNGIHFTRTGVCFCNKLSSMNSLFSVPYENDFYNKFLSEKNNVIENCRSGSVPDSCKDCMYLEEKDWDLEADYRINNIELFHWNQCNCACIYCGNRSETKLKITKKKGKSDFVDLYKTLKNFIKEKHFSDVVNVSFVGGEPTLLKEFPDILRLFLKNNYKMHILTNGILYDSLYAKALKKSKDNYITISLDCGSADMFKKIKGVDKFDDVVKHIKMYVKNSGNNSKNLYIKYILIEGLNDNKEEILKWIELCKCLGVKTLHPTIEFCHSVNNPNINGPSENICEMYEFMKEKIIENGFYINTYDFVEVMVKNRSYK